MAIDLDRADEVVRKLWERNAEVWDHHWAPIFRSFARDLVRDARASPGKLILDIGTGTGIAAMEAVRLVRPDGFVLGIDRLHSMVEFAEKNRIGVGCRNVRFSQMNSRRLFYPDGMFDAVVSNCGISAIGFHQTIAEVLRVLTNGGVFVFNQWGSRNVPAHKIFSCVLGRYRTDHPSRSLKVARSAHAALERLNSRVMNPPWQVRELKRVGFGKAEAERRYYTVTLPNIGAYFDMRLKMTTLNQELRELSPAGRKAFIAALRKELEVFVKGKWFTFDWRVTFISARK